MSESSRHHSDPAVDATPPDSQRPTNIRWMVVLSATLMSILLYLDRFCYSFAERLITEDLGLTNTQSSLIQGVFFLTYAVGQVPAGWLGDKYGARWMLTIFILIWSLFTGLIGLATSFGALILLRAGLGLGQAGAYPVSGATVARWIPVQSRGLASSFVAGGGRLGGFIAPVLTGLVIILFVPLSMSSEIQSETLINPDEFAAQIAVEAGYLQRDEGGANENSKTAREREREKMTRELASVASKRVFTFLPEPAQRVVVVAGGQRIAAEKELAAEHRAKQGNKGTPEFSTLPRKISDRDLGILVDGFNELLKRPDFYVAGAFPQVDLSRESKGILQKREEGKELTVAEATRLNRHALEGIYPKQLHKLYSAGWRPMFKVFGSLGIFVAGLFWFIVRDNPGEHPFCNAAELQLIAPSTTGKVAAKARLDRPPFAALIGSWNMWCNSVSQFGTNVGWLFILVWFPRYLTEVHRVPIMERAFLVSIPLGTAMVGLLLGGRWTDWLTPRVGLKWGRRIPWSGTKVVAVIAFLSCIGAESVWHVTIALAVVTIFTDLGVGSAWAFAQDVGGRHVGSVLGWGNMWGNIGAACSPLLLNYIIENFGWDANFMACATAFLVSGLASLGVDATKPLFPPEKEPEPT